MGMSGCPQRCLQRSRHHQETAFLDQTLSDKKALMFCAVWRGGLKSCFHQLHLRTFCHQRLWPCWENNVPKLLLKRRILLNVCLTTFSCVDLAAVGLEVPCIHDPQRQWHAAEVAFLGGTTWYMKQFKCGVCFP